ncbi:hypothetical protein MMC22_003662 [Lobaria immixta]|nr:hypothetical protein [Lobaria immixta]
MASSQSSKSRIILDKPEHWDGWISFIRTTVQDPYLWGLVDPDLPTKPARTPYPEEPMRPGVDANGIYDVLELQQYKTKRLFGEEDINTSSYENKALHDISKLIFETTSTRMINQVVTPIPIRGASL